MTALIETQPCVYCGQAIARYSLVELARVAIRGARPAFPTSLVIRPQCPACKRDNRIELKFYGLSTEQRAALRAELDA